MYYFCVYMRCDINELSNIDEYESILLEVSTLCIKYKVQYMCSILTKRSTCRNIPKP